jgi:LysM repeat protein
MALLNGFQGSVNDITNKIRNPFEQTVNADFDAPDFPDGFKIEEILPTGASGDKIVFAGNWMPKIPFSFGGKQRMKKEYYSGYSEPSVQVFGPEELPITINGTFKDKRFSNPQLKNISEEMQKEVDAVRIRGNVVRLQLGEFERYAIIEETKFDLERLSRINYSITFFVIGFNAPKNAIFLQRKKEVPFGINKELIALATEFQLNSSTIPDSVPRSIADIINGVTSEVAEVLATVTNFVDAIFTTVQDIKSSVNRIKGLIKYAQQVLSRYKRQLGSLASFDPSTSIAGRYDYGKYTTSSIAAASSLTSLLQRLFAQFSNIINTLPLARRLVKTGDTLQKISVEYYGNSGNWKEIYDYNDLTNTDLQIGRLIEIPRI